MQLKEKACRIVAFWLVLLITLLTSGCGSSSTATPKPAYQLVQTIIGPGFFYRSIARTPNGEILAALATSPDGILRYTPQADGQYSATTFTDRDSWAMTCSPTSGRVFAVRDKEVDIFDSAGQLLATKTLTVRPISFALSDVQANHLGDVFVLTDNRPDAEQVIRLDEEGNKVNSFNLGKEYGSQVCLTTDSSGNLAVVGQERNTNDPSPPTVLRVFSPEGTLLRETPLDPRKLPDGLSPQGMTIGPDGKLYITEGLGPFILYVFDYQSGEQLIKQTDMKNASADIAVDSSGNLYILGGVFLHIYRPTP